MSVQVKGSGTIGGIDEGLNITGIVTATSFVGSGANLTGVIADIVNDISPQLGGNLDTNSFEILLDDSHAVKFGSNNEMEMFHASNGVSKIEDSGGGFHIRQINNGDIHIHAGTNTSTSNNRLVARAAGSAELYYSGSKKIETTNTGATVTGNLAFASGNGIDFSASGNAGGMTSEVLDDYEEGLWTPSVTIETRPASDSPIDNIQGNYIKVGGLVHAFGQFALNGTPSERSTSRAIELRGFPFTHNYSYDKCGGDIRSSGHLINSTYGSDIYFVMRMINGAAYCRIEIIEQGYVGTRNASPVMTDNMYVIFSFTYSAA